MFFHYSTSILYLVVSNACIMQLLKKDHVFSINKKLTSNDGHVGNHYFCGQNL